MKVEEYNVEEDGDEVITFMPKECFRWKCKKAKIIKNDKGFMVCSNCGVSYGKK